MKVDLFEFARLAEEAGGTLAIALMKRVETPDPSGSLRWRAIGSESGREKNAFLDLQVEGDIALVCQRCLQPMRQPLAIASKFLIVADERTAELLDEDDAFDVLVGAPDFDLPSLVEDEVILALPIAPKHAVCPPGAIDALAVTERPSPFAVLAALKKPGPADEGQEPH